MGRSARQVPLQPSSRVRPHVKFGIARTDFDAELPGNPTLSDDGVGVSVGGGLEAGNQEAAFFGDADVQVVSLFQEDFTICDVTLGIIFKF